MASSTTRLRLAVMQPRVAPSSTIPRTMQQQHNLCLHLHARTFTSSSARHALPKGGQAQQQFSGKRPPQRAMNLAMKEQRATQEMPDDVGILPETFILPRPSNRPSLSSPREFWRLYRTYAWQRTKHTGITLFMKLWYIRNPSSPTSSTYTSPYPPLASTSTRKPSLLTRVRSFFHRRLTSFNSIPNLQISSIPSTATNLYKKMYTSLATGDIDSIRPLLCESIFSSLKGRVVARPPNTKMHWTLHEWVRKPRVVSHRIVPMELSSTGATARTALQQAVVRMESLQSLKKVKSVRGKDGQMRDVVVEEEGRMGVASAKREVLEYFVVQRTLRKGVWGPWKVWGTTEEMTLEKWDRMTGVGEEDAEKAR